MPKREEIIDAILYGLREITTEQFYLFSLKKIMQLKLIQGTVHKLEDLNNLSEASLTKINSEIVDIMAMQMKEKARFAGRRQEKSPELPPKKENDLFP